VDTTRLERPLGGWARGRVYQRQHVASSCIFNESDELRNRSNFEFRHDAFAMRLHGSLGCTQLRGNLSVVQTPDQSRGNLALASGEAIHALDEHVIKPLLRFGASTLLEASRHGSHELFGIDGLGQKVDGPTFHGLDDRPDIAATRHENYREGALTLEATL
jgi:hypothetical protein